MIKNRLLSTGQTIVLATGENYIIKDDEVQINGNLFKKIDLETSLQNVHEGNSPESVKIAIVKRSGVLEMPSDFCKFDQWSIDGVEQTSLALCLENINTLIYFQTGITDYNDLENTPVFKVVENSYDDVAELYANQGNQTTSFIQFIEDASGHPEITSGQGYFEYLGTTNGDETDYRLLSDSESAPIQNSVAKTSDIPLNDGEIEGDGDRFLLESELKLVNNANLIIGNGGATIPDEATLSSKFEIGTITINDFKIINNTVYANVVISARLIASAFINNTDITSFETDQPISRLGANAFQGCTNLKYIKTPNASFLDQFFISGASNLILEDCDFTNTLTVQRDGFNGAPNGTVNLPNVTGTASAYAYRGFAGRVNLDSYNKPNGIILGGSSADLYLPSLLDLGDPATNSQIFYLISASAIIYVPYVHKTSNNGSPDGDIAYVLSRGTTVNYIDPPEQLEITTSITLDASHNGIDLLFNSATPITVTINDLGLLSYGISGYNKGAGIVTFVAGTGVLTSDDGSDLDEGKVCTLFQYLGTNEYILKGELS